MRKDNEGRASEAGGRKESEKMTKTMQAKQAAEKKAKTKRGPCKRSRRPKREQNDNEGRAGLCRAVLTVLGCAWLCLAVLGYAWLCLAVLGYAWLAFVNLKRRFPFACCSGFRVIGAHFRSKIDLKHDQNSS